MTTERLLLLAVIFVPILLVNLGKLRIDVAALGTAIVLGSLQALGLGVLGPPHTPDAAVAALSGFGQPAVITLLSLFILTKALEESGATRWLAMVLLRVGGTSERRLIVLFATATATLSLVMNNLAAGALVVPSALEACRQTGIKPSKLLMPVAYGSLLGGAATYFTTANIIVSNLLTTAHPPQDALHILDFTPTGGLIAVVGIVFLGLFGSRLLPDRELSAEQRQARRSGTELEAIYELGARMWEAPMHAGSPWVGQTIEQLELGNDLGISLAAIVRGRAIVGADVHETVRVGDTLVLIGRDERIEQLQARGVAVQQARGRDPLSARGLHLIELVLAPHAAAKGRTLKALAFRSRYNTTAIALLRKGRSFRTDVSDMPLEVGDAILMAGNEKDIQALKAVPEFFAIEPAATGKPVDVRGALIAGGAIAGAVVLSAAGFPDFLAITAGAVLVVLLGRLTMDEAYRAVDWQAIFLVAGMYAVSRALVVTGLAEIAGGAVVAAVKPFGGLGLAAGAYLLTGGLSQIMGGQVATLITGPVLISSAITLGSNPQAVAVAAAIGCSASFLTPIAHPVNILVMGPGGYSFRDFFRTGLPLTAVSFLALLLGLKLFWGL